MTTKMTAPKNLYSYSSPTFICRLVVVCYRTRSHHSAMCTMSYEDTRMFRWAPKCISAHFYIPKNPKWPKIYILHTTVYTLVKRSLCELSNMYIAKQPVRLGPPPRCRGNSFNSLAGVNIYYTTAEDLRSYKPQEDIYGTTIHNYVANRAVLYCTTRVSSKVNLSGCGICCAQSNNASCEAKEERVLSRKHLDLVVVHRTYIEFCKLVDSSKYECIYW